MEATSLGILCKPFVVLTILAAATFAGPKIEFDTKRFNYGTAIEGKTDKINATFVVKNIGNEVLRVENVRPGCGCTVVRYDKVIKPGKSAKIEADVNITGYNGGPLSKYITVNSNAENEPAVRLTIETTIKAIIDVSENYLALDKSNIRSPKSLFLTTKKADLKVIDIRFKPLGYLTKSRRKANEPLSIKYLWTPTDSTVVNGYRVFKMDMYSPEIKDAASGEFIIKTNHPEKPKITLRGKFSNI